jgi:hypothetical protein
VTRDQFEALTAEPPSLSWQEGWDEVSAGFTTPWRMGTAKQVYAELYRSLTHGYGISPDAAVALLGAARFVAVNDATP